MKLILIALLLSGFCFSAQAQNETKKQELYGNTTTVDSSFMKLVTGLNHLLRDRVKADFPKFSSVSYSNYVIIDKVRKVSIDSLYKYKLKDFKSITVSFEESVALYGGKSEQGVIILKRKESQ